MSALQRYLFPGRIGAALLRRWRVLRRDAKAFFSPDARTYALVPVPVRSESPDVRRCVMRRERS